MPPGRDPPPEAAPAPSVETPLTAMRAVAATLAGLFCIVLTGIAIRHSELVTGQYISTGVPPLPALGVLVALAAVAPPLQRRFPRLAPSRAQILLIYCMLTVAIVLNGLYHIRAFLPHLVSLQYGGRSEPRLLEYARFLPAWYAPHDPEAIRSYYEGAREKPLPWAVWAAPLGAWTLFFLAIFVGAFSLTTLLRKPWTQDERLSFPLVTLPLALTKSDWSEFGSRAQRRALFRLGFGLAAAYSAINIAHAFAPWLPALPFSIGLEGISLERPWTPLGAVRAYFMLDAVGIGYLVPLDLLFSVWFFYLCNRAFAVAGTLAGWDEPGFPFTQQQSAGGYIALGLLLLWRLRRPLRASLGRAFGPSASDASGERWAWIGLAGSAFCALGYCRLAGLSLWLAVPFFAILGLFTLVYIRIRGEVGVPFQFIYPWTMPKTMLLDFFSVPNAMIWGGASSMVLLSSLAWLSSNHHPLEQAAYQFDSARIASEAKIPHRVLFVALLLAFVVGLWTAFGTHLSAYYAQGSNLIPSAGGYGEYRAAMAREEYQRMASQLASVAPAPPGPKRAYLAGFLFTALLVTLRSLWPGSPFHPFGFLISTAFGNTSTSWFPLLLAWAAKFVLLRYGGLRLYRQGIPFFLGLAVGHFVTGGLIWPLLGQVVSPDAANSYHLLFGE